MIRRILLVVSLLLFCACGSTTYNPRLSTHMRVVLKSGAVVPCTLLFEGLLLFTCDIPRDSVLEIRR